MSVSYVPVPEVLSSLVPKLDARRPFEAADSASSSLGEKRSFSWALAEPVPPVPTFSPALDIKRDGTGPVRATTSLPPAERMTEAVTGGGAFRLTLTGLFPTPAGTVKRCPLSEVEVSWPGKGSDRRFCAWWLKGVAAISGD